MIVFDNYKLFKLKFVLTENVQIENFHVWVGQKIWTIERRLLFGKIFTITDNDNEQNNAIYFMRKVSSFLMENDTLIVSSNFLVPQMVVA